VRRQFLRVYLGMAGVLLLAAGTAAFFGERELRRAVDQRVNNSLQPLVLGIQERLNDAGDDPQERAATLRRMGERVPFPIRLVPTDELEDLKPKELNRLAQGGTVGVRSDSARYLYAQLNSKETLVVGPLRGPRHDGPRWRQGGRWRSRQFESQWSPYPLIGTLMAVLTLIGFTIFLLIRPLERRILALSDISRRFGQGELEARATVDRDDAVGEVATAFNWMAERLKGLIDGQKELLRAISHELRTPLARLFFVLDEAQDAQTAQEKNRHLGRMDKSLNELNSLIEELLAFVRLEGEENPALPDPLDPAALLADFADVAAELSPDVAIEIDCAPAQVHADARLLRRAALNLLTNAVRHAQRTVHIQGQIHEGGYLLRFDDDGPGVPPQARTRLFEPFFRLDESRTTGLGGTGLGLAIVARVAERHQGRVEVGDSPQGGARFSFWLPL
jgi:two-component system, OmpR family, sensor histidine kinase RstB